MAIGRTLHRRTLLRGSGACMALPFLDAMVPAAVAAGRETAEVAPMRMAITVTPWGFWEPTFRPNGSGSNYKMPEVLATLNKHRRHMAVFSGLDHGLKGGHDAMHTVLTGVHNRGPYQSPMEENPNGVMSLDQRAAEHVGYGTRFPSMSLWHARDYSWSRYRIPIPAVRGGVEGVYKQLFIDNTSPAQRQQQAENLLARNSVLDLVKSDADSLQHRLGTTDRKKLDEYFTAVRETERRIASSADWLTKPRPKVDMAMPSNGMSVNDEYPIWYDMMFLALQTDQTRVVTLGVPGDGWQSVDGVTNGNHHALGHDGTVAQLNAIEKYQLANFGRFLDKLKESKDLDGRSMFDTTINLMISTMQDSGRRHGTNDLPIIMAGGGFRVGGHAKMKRGMPLNNLYLSMLRRFGVETDVFNTSKGTLPGLSA